MCTLPKPMAAAEMDADLEDMRSYLSVTSCTVKRCDHPTVEMTSLWVFDKDGAHIASFSRHVTGSEWKWQGQKFYRGGPVTNLPFRNLNEAAAYVCRCC